MKSSLKSVVLRLVPHLSTVSLAVAYGLFLFRGNTFGN